MEFIFQPWPWYIVGPLISLTMFIMIFFGKSLGMSSNLENICAIGGAGRFVTYFKFDWRKNSWNLVLMIGVAIGGFIAMNYLTPDKTIAISTQTITDLSELGFQNAGKGYLPEEIFSIDALLSFKGFSILIIAGFLVGFGARYAGGCTSGHAIVGLSMLERPSLISVIGFFIGGLVMTWFILPLLFS